MQKPAEFKIIGRIKTRSAHEIKSSNWSVGAETMYRGFSTYAYWKDYLGPLGVKKARIQSGWARTEPSPGNYEFAWLDAIIQDMTIQGVAPWVSLGFGNPIHGAHGGTPNVSSPLPSGAALPAWDAFVSTIVARYRREVREWEIWNEPDHRHHYNTPEAYGDFVIRTAERIRAIQPDAVIIAGALCFAKLETYGGELARYLMQRNRLDLVDQLSFHPYNVNPDTAYPRVRAFQEQLAQAGMGRLRLRQGENGVPSQRDTMGAMKNIDWTERMQAKWVLRRMLGDLGCDIESSIFSIIDMHYAPDNAIPEPGGYRAGGVNHKGLILTDEQADTPVDRQKPLRVK